MFVAVNFSDAVLGLRTLLRTGGVQGLVLKPMPYFTDLMSVVEGVGMYLRTWVWRHGGRCLSQDAALVW